MNGSNLRRTTMSSSGQLRNEGAYSFAGIRTSSEIIYLKSGKPALRLYFSPTTIAAQGDGPESWRFTTKRSPSGFRKQVGKRSSFEWERPGSARSGRTRTSKSASGGYKTPKSNDRNGASQPVRGLRSEPQSHNGLRVDRVGRRPSAYESDVPVPAPANASSKSFIALPKFLGVTT